MRIVSEKKLREFWKQHPLSESVMRQRIKTVTYANWNTFGDICETFNHADIYGSCVIFDVGGNKYRIIGKVAYKSKVAFIRICLTHSEYDENKWQSDC